MIKTRLSSPGIYLGALSVIFGYSVFRYGGVLTEDWSRCLVALGLLTLLYFRFTAENDVAPALESRFRWPLVLLLVFIGFQLVPLPLSLLEILSPTRAELLQSLDRVVPGTRSAPISVFPSATLAHLLRMAAYAVVFVLTRELAWRTPARRWLIVAPIIAVAAVESVLGLLQYDPVDRTSFARGTYVNQNHFAGLLELALPFAAVYPITVLAARRRHRFRPELSALAIAVAVLILIAIIFSMSRMGFAASFSSLFMMGMLVMRGQASSRKRFIAPGLVAVSLIVGFFYLAPDSLIGRFGEALGGSEITPGERIQMWRDTWQLAKNYPLAGCGLGAFESAFLRYKAVAPQFAVDFAHNDYLQLFVELGVVGFALVAAFMAALFFRTIVTALDRVDSQDRYLGIACFGSFVAILIHSLTDFNFYIPANAMLLAWISGVAASLQLRSQRTVPWKTLGLARVIDVDASDVSRA
jgi:O-antigen ligase